MSFMDSRFFSFGLILLLELVLEGCSLAIVAAFSLRITAFSLVLPEIHRWENTRTSLLLHLVPLSVQQSTQLAQEMFLCAVLSVHWFPLKLWLRGLLVSPVGLLRRWNYSSFLNEESCVLKYAMVPTGSRKWNLFKRTPLLVRFYILLATKYVLL